MFTILCILAVIYAILKISNTRARFAEADARREEEEARLMAEAEEAAEDELIRSEAIDVDAEIVDADGTETVEFDVEEKQ